MLHDVQAIAAEVICKIHKPTFGIEIAPLSISPTFV